MCVCVCVCVRVCVRVCVCVCVCGGNHTKGRHSYMSMDYTWRTGGPTVGTPLRPLKIPAEHHANKDSWAVPITKTTSLKDRLQVLQIVHSQCHIYIRSAQNSPISVAVRSKARVCGRLLVATVGSNPAGDMNVCLSWVLCIGQVQAFATGWSLIHRIPTDCGVSECDHKSSKMRRPWPTGGLLHHGKIKLNIINSVFPSLWFVCGILLVTDSR